MYQITMQKVEEVTHNNEPKDNYYATVRNVQRITSLGHISDWTFA